MQPPCIHSSFSYLQCLFARYNLNKDEELSNRKWVFVFADSQVKEGVMMNRTIMESLNYMKVGSVV